MTVHITVGIISEELGAPDFVRAFFSTVSAHCEPEGWGTRFPHLMKELYHGRLPHAHAEAALAELAQAQAVLDELPGSDVVWDIDDRSVRPPWLNAIAGSVTSLGSYFKTSGGREMFALLQDSLQSAHYEHADAVIA